MQLFKKLKFKTKSKLYDILKPQLVVLYRVKVGNKTVQENYAESLTIGFLAWLYAQFSQGSGNFAASLENGGLYTNKRVRSVTGGYADCQGHFMQMNGGTGAVDKGIILGTGTTAPSPLDYKIETIIPHGVAVGNLSYQSQLALNPILVVGQDTNFKLHRIFVNNSGATINVSELTLYALNAGVSSAVCLLRDTFSPVTLLDTQTATVEIEFKITT